ncbi:unnamed protein product, partial [Mesorhabditis spiculigera]
MELKNPFLMLTVPERLRANKELIENLKVNAQHLITHFDLHATLLHILEDPENFVAKPVVDPNNATSILRPLSPAENRSCRDIPVPASYCLCEFDKEPLSPDKYREMADYAVREINRKLADERLAGVCANLTLGSVISVEAYAPEMVTKLYEITFDLHQNRARFRATIRGDVMVPSTFELTGGVDRINEYGKTADCIADQKPQMSPYCYCTGAKL